MSKVKNTMETKVVVDLTKKSRKTLKNISDSLGNKKKHKRVRIEFDDIYDVPEVYIDGKFINSDDQENGLVNLLINWKTDDWCKRRKFMEIRWLADGGYKELSQTFKPDVMSNGDGTIDV